MMLAHYSHYWKEGDDRPLFAFKEEKTKQTESVILCGVTDCRNKSTHKWSGHPTCDEHASQFRM